MSKPLRVGLIGAGWVTQHHLAGWARLRPDARVVAIADPQRETAQARAKAFDIPEVFTDARTMLRAGADKVSLSTAAVIGPDLIDEAALQFGSQCVVLSVDTRRAPGIASGFEVTTHGGREGTGRDTLAWVREAVDRGGGEDHSGSREGES